MTPSELYEAKAEEAAEAYRWTGKDVARCSLDELAEGTFKAGIKWATSNLASHPKVVKLLEALEFYGKVYNFDNCFRSDLGSYVPANSEGTSEIETDRGKRARQCLAELKTEVSE